MSLFETMIALILHPFAMLLYGLLTHFIRKRLANVTHETEERACITDYWKAHPLQSMISVVGALVGYALLVGATIPADEQVLQLMRMTAFGVGYMADNMADAIGEQTIRKVPGVFNKGVKPSGGE